MSNDCYGTPTDLYQELDNRFHFMLDPCAWPNNRLGTEFFYTEKDDGLSKNWWAGPVFCNPPYSNVAPWLSKAKEAAERGVMSVFLLRFDPSTVWWGRYIENRHTSVIPIPYRLKFIEYPSGEQSGAYPFPSCLVIMHGLF